MPKPKHMDQIKAIARQLKISKNTVWEYVRRAETHAGGLPGILDLVVVWR